MTTLEPDIDPSLATLADAVLIPPFHGTTPPEWILDALGRGLAGVTLFGSNVTGDTSHLTAALRAATGTEPVIAIDEEGGDVTRVGYAEGSPYPGNAALGVVDDVVLTRDVYAAIGADLRRMGINTNLAPCADVLSFEGSPAVGTRSFGSDPLLAARHVAAAVAGLQEAGVAACAKHFPGHGSTSADSHEALATISGSMEDIRRRDLPPFEAAIAAGTWCLMPGHLRVPELTGDLPATLSPAAVTGLLRGGLGFTGTVICDALEMKAASAAFGIPEAAVLAVIAGVDLLCLGRDTDEEMYHAIRAALADAVTSGRLAGSRLEEAADQIVRVGTGTGESIDVAGERHAVKRFFLCLIGLGFGDGLADVGKLLRGDVLLFVDLPNLIFALVGDARVFGFFDFDAEFFEFAREPIGGLHRGVVFAAEILLDVVVQVRVHDLRGKLRALRFELDVDQAAARNALDREAAEKGAENRGTRRGVAIFARSRCGHTTEFGIALQIHRFDGD